MNRIKIVENELSITYGDGEEIKISLDSFTALTEEKFANVLEVLSDPRLLENLNTFEEDKGIDNEFANVQNFLFDYFFRVNNKVKEKLDTE